MDPESQENQVDLAEMLKDTPFEYRPEHDVYFVALQQVWDDNIVTDDERRMLEGLQQSLEISKAEHDFLESKIIKNDPAQRVDAYRRVLEQAWADGIITADEQAILTNLREKLQITDEEHQTLEKEITQNIPKNTEYPPGENEADAGYWIRKGEDLWSASDGNEEDAKTAISYFDNAIQIEPLNYYAWVNKGLILKKLDQRPEAIQCYDRAIQIQPEFPNSWFNKGVLLGCMGQLEDAVNCFEKVLEISPNHQLAQRDKQMLEEIIKRKHSSRIKTRVIKVKQ